MSVLSILRRGRQQAKEHQAKLHEQQKKEAEKPKYKHVPTHAREDSINSGAPPSWRYEDSQRIVEQNRRRSAMALGAASTPGTRTPMRVASSLSQVAYPDDEADPIVQMPRSYSYSAAMGPYWQTRSQSYYLNDGPMSTTSIKGKEVDRRATTMFDPSGRSSRMSTQAASPVGSSSNSTSSDEGLEMRPGRSGRYSVPVQPSVASAMGAGPSGTRPVSSRPPAAYENAHRLHPSRRRASDASIERVNAAIQGKPAGPGVAQREFRPVAPARSNTTPVPPVPPVPALPTVHMNAPVAPASFPAPASQQAVPQQAVPQQAVPLQVVSQHAAPQPAMPQHSVQQKHSFPPQSSSSASTTSLAASVSSTSQASTITTTHNASPVPEKDDATMAAPTPATAPAGAVAQGFEFPFVNTSIPSSELFPSALDPKEQLAADPAPAAAPAPIPAPVSAPAPAPQQYAMAPRPTPTHTMSAPAPASRSVMRPRGVPKMARFSEVDIMESFPEHRRALPHESHQSERQTAPSAISHERLSQYMPVPPQLPPPAAAAPVPEPPSSTSGRKLSKNRGSKLVKKNRLSLAAVLG